MKFYEIVPELLNGKKFISKAWIDRDHMHIYAVHHDDGSFHLMRSDDFRVTLTTIGTWLAANNNDWEEYSVYPKDLDFVEACRLARENGAIISATDRVKYDWHNGMLREYSTSKPFESDLFIFYKWHVVEYKGEQ